MVIWTRSTPLGAGRGGLRDGMTGPCTRPLSLSRELAQGWSTQKEGLEEDKLSSDVVMQRKTELSGHLPSVVACSIASPFSTPISSSHQGLTQLTICLFVLGSVPVSDLFHRQPQSDPLRAYNVACASATATTVLPLESETPIGKADL